MFIAPVVWALILAYVSWPLYARLRRLLRGNATLSALLMTLLLTMAFVLPLLGLIGLLQSEFILAYQAVSAYLNEAPHRLPDFILHIPWLGERLQQFLDSIAGDPEMLRTEALRWAQNWFGELANLVQILFVHAGTEQNPGSYVEPLRVGTDGSIENWPEASAKP